MPGARCARSLACKTKKHGELVTTVTPVSPGIPRANGFNGFLRALPGDRALLSPSPAAIASANLMPASRHQDHTTSPSATGAFVLCTVASIASRAQRFVTIAKRPSRRARDARKSAGDLPDVTSENACGELARRANQPRSGNSCQVQSNCSALVIPGLRLAAAWRRIPE
jgi:hypothetical protein